MIVGSPAPQAVVSPAIGSTTKTAEMMLASAAATGVRLGAIGGLEPPAGRPQLNSPPGPLRFTAPAAHTYVGATPPELAQSYAAPLAGLNRMPPSTASQPDRAALTTAHARTPTSSAAP